MIAIVRQPVAPPPSMATPPTVALWMSRFVPKANTKRMEPICTRSPPLRVMRAVNEE